MLVPGTAELANAAISDGDRFAQLLHAHVTDQWPPEVLADVEQMFADRLNAEPERVGWYGWYIIAANTQLAPIDTLVGSIGCMPPANDGTVMFGYSVLPDFEGRGIATEAALAFVGWLIAQPGIALVRADSFERNLASCRILQRCGLSLVGTSPDDPTAPESDRKGRGTLLRFERLVGGSWGG